MYRRGHIAKKVGRAEMQFGSVAEMRSWLSAVRRELVAWSKTRNRLSHQGAHTEKTNPCDIWL